MTHYWFCGACGRIAVHRSGALCPRCDSTVAALVDPIVRPPLPQRPPAGVRFLNWLTGRTVA